MNKITLHILEYDKIIQIIMDMALSDLGRSLIAAIKPSTDLDRITLQLEEVSEAKAILNTTSAVPIPNMNGINNVLDKLGHGTSLRPEDLTHISAMLHSIKRLKSFMDERHDIAPIVSSYAMSMYPLSEVTGEINTCIHNNRVDDQASVHLEKIRKRMYIAENRIKSKLESFTKSTVYKKFLQDASISIKNNRYVISVKSEYKHSINGTIISKSSTGSTFFIEPTAVGQLQNELDMLKIDEEQEEYQILMYLTALIEDHKQEISINIESLAYYDFLFAKAKYSRHINGQKATVNHDGHTTIINGRHPLLGLDCVPLNFSIGKDYRSLIITGPNTGGKTVVLKSVGLFTAMIQSGLHVPVDVGSAFAIYSDILVDIGDGQSIEQSLSTFSSHIKNIVQIMKIANPYTLVLLDEVGAGTDPTEGEGLAVAILEQLHKKGATIIATSHYSAVKTFASKQEGFKNGKMHFNLDTLKPNYILEIGHPGESNAFIIALRLGMEQSVIEKAHCISYDEAKDYSNMAKSQPLITPNHLYPKAKRPKSIKKQLEKSHKIQKPEVTYHIGDSVYIHTLKQRGIVFEEENSKGEIGIKIHDKKIYTPKKRISMFIEGKQLYPENYDFDVLFETVDYRKKNRIMSKRYDKNIEIVYKEGDQI